MTTETTPETPDVEPAVETETTEDTKPDREAARYRRQLRATEAERDALATRLEAMQRSAVEQHAARSLAKPEALWASGVELASLLTEDGTVDVAKVSAAATAAADQLGLARSQRVPTAPRFGPASHTPSNGWAKAFGPKDRD